jgi:CO/xanthine dehydrogenase Mo-binding subunit
VPWHIRRIVSRAIQVPIKKICVIKPRIGGGFGGKQDMILEDLCAFGALKYNRSVIAVMSRSEVFTSARVRHPVENKLEIIFKKTGIIKAIDMDLLLNTGAYGGHALTVASNAGSKTLSLLSRVPHVKFHARAAYTNLPIAGAFRGYGAIQAYFGLGVMIDRIAEELKKDPIEIYLKNSVKEGESPKILESLGEGGEGCPITFNSVGLYECIARGAEEIGWYKKHRLYREPGCFQSDCEGSNQVRGVGMACILQGSGVPDIDMGAVTLKLNEDGSFNLLCGATDLGTGSDTLMAVIAAEVLETEPDMFIVTSSDTDVTPFDVGAYASSTTFVSGEACRRAALKMKQALIEAAAEILDIPAGELELKSAGIEGRGQRLTFAKIGTSTMYLKNQRQICVTGSNCSPTSPPPFSAHFAEISVDKETGRIYIIKYVAAVDCGTPINPVQAKGQTEGGVLTGIGQALYEEYHFGQKGNLMNSSFEHYKMPGPLDTPDIKTILVPTWEPDGPFGAKSVSEVAVNGPMPAIANALYDACRIRLNRAPFTPERVLRALNEK